MPKSLNKCYVAGHIGKIEHRMSANGKDYTTFSIAVTTGWNKDKQPETSWFNCIAFGDIARTIYTQYQKGSWISVQGNHRQETWIGRDGTQQRTWKLYVWETYTLEQTFGKEYVEKYNERQKKKQQQQQEEYQGGPDIRNSIPSESWGNEDIPF